MENLIEFLGSVHKYVPQYMSSLDVIEKMLPSEHGVTEQCKAYTASWCNQLQSEYNLVLETIVLILYKRSHESSVLSTRHISSLLRYGSENRFLGPVHCLTYLVRYYSHSYNTPLAQITNGSCTGFKHLASLLSAQLERMAQKVLHCKLNHVVILSSFLQYWWITAAKHELLTLVDGFHGIQLNNAKAVSSDREMGSGSDTTLNICDIPNGTVMSFVENLQGSILHTEPHNLLNAASSDADKHDYSEWNELDRVIRDCVSADASRNMGDDDLLVASNVFNQETSRYVHSDAIGYCLGYTWGLLLYETHNLVVLYAHLHAQCSEMLRAKDLQGSGGDSNLGMPPYHFLYRFMQWIQNASGVFRYHIYLQSADLHRIGSMKCIYCLVKSVLLNTKCNNSGPGSCASNGSTVAMDSVADHVEFNGVYNDLLGCNDEWSPRGVEVEHCAGGYNMSRVSVSDSIFTSPLVLEYVQILQEVVNAIIQVFYCTNLDSSLHFRVIMTNILKNSYSIGNGSLVSLSSDAKNAVVLTKHCSAIANGAVSVDLSIYEECDYGIEEVGDSSNMELLCGLIEHLYSSNLYGGNNLTDMFWNNWKASGMYGLEGISVGGDYSIDQLHCLGAYPLCQFVYELTQKTFHFPVYLLRILSVLVCDAYTAREVLMTCALRNINIIEYQPVELLLYSCVIIPKGGEKLEEQPDENDLWYHFDGCLQIDRINKQRMSSSGGDDSIVSNSMPEDADVDEMRKISNAITGKRVCFKEVNLSEPTNSWRKIVKFGDLCGYCVPKLDAEGVVIGVTTQEYGNIMRRTVQPPGIQNEPYCAVVQWSETPLSWLLNILCSFEHSCEQTCQLLKKPSIACDMHFQHNISSCVSTLDFLYCQIRFPENLAVFFTVLQLNWEMLQIYGILSNYCEVEEDAQSNSNATASGLRKDDLKGIYQHVWKLWESGELSLDIVKAYPKRFYDMLIKFGVESCPAVTTNLAGVIVNEILTKMNLSDTVNVIQWLIVKNISKLMESTYHVMTTVKPSVGVSVPDTISSISYNIYNKCVLMYHALMVYFQEKTSNRLLDAGSVFFKPIDHQYQYMLKVLSLNPFLKISSMKSAAEFSNFPVLFEHLMKRNHGVYMTERHRKIDHKVVVDGNFVDDTLRMSLSVNGAAPVSYADWVKSMIAIMAYMFSNIKNVYECKYRERVLSLMNLFISAEGTGSEINEAQSEISSYVIGRNSFVSVITMLMNQVHLSGVCRPQESEIEAFFRDHSVGNNGVALQLDSVFKMVNSNGVSTGHVVYDYIVSLLQVYVAEYVEDFRNAYVSYTSSVLDMVGSLLTCYSVQVVGQTKEQTAVSSVGHLNQDTVMITLQLLHTIVSSIQASNTTTNMTKSGQFNLLVSYECYSVGLLLMKKVLTVFFSDQTVLLTLLRCGICLTLHSLCSSSAGKMNSPSKNIGNSKNSLQTTGNVLGKSEGKDEDKDSNFWSNLFTNKAIDQMDIGELAVKIPTAPSVAASGVAKVVKKSGSLFPFEFFRTQNDGSAVSIQRRGGDIVDDAEDDNPTDRSPGNLEEKLRVYISALALDTLQRLLSLLMAYSLVSSSDAVSGQRQKQDREEVNSWICNIYEVLASDLKKSMGVAVSTSKDAQESAFAATCISSTCFAGAAVLIDYPDNTVSKLVVQFMTALIVAKSKYQAAVLVKPVAMAGDKGISKLRGRVETPKRGIPVKHSDPSHHSLVSLLGNENCPEFCASLQDILVTASDTSNVSFYSSHLKSAVLDLLLVLIDKEPVTSFSVLLKSGDSLFSGQTQAESNSVDEKSTALMATLKSLLLKVDFYYKRTPVVAYKVLELLLRMCNSNKAMSSSGTTFGSGSVSFGTTRKRKQSKVGESMHASQGSALSDAFVSDQEYAEWNAEKTSGFGRPVKQRSGFVESANVSVVPVHLAPKVDSNHVYCSFNEYVIQLLKTSDIWKQMSQPLFVDLSAPPTVDDGAVSTPTILSSSHKEVKIFCDRMLVHSCLLKLITLERYGAFFAMNDDNFGSTVRRIVDSILMRANDAHRFLSWTKHYMTISFRREEYVVYKDTENMLSKLFLKPSVSRGIGGVSLKNTQLSRCFSTIDMADTDMDCKHFLENDNASIHVNRFGAYYQYNIHDLARLGNEKQSSSHVKNIYKLNLMRSISDAQLALLQSWRIFLEVYVLQTEFVHANKSASSTSASAGSRSSSPKQLSNVLNSLGTSISGRRSRSNSREYTGLYADNSKDKSAPSSPRYDSPTLSSQPMNQGQFSPSLRSSSTGSAPPSPASQRISSFSGDKRSYEIVTEVIRTIVRSNTGSESSNEELDYLESNNMVSLQSLSEKCHLLASMIHHQLREVKNRTLDPSLSQVVVRSTGTTRLTLTKMNTLFDMIHTILQKVLQVNNAISEADSDSNAPNKDLVRSIISLLLTCFVLLLKSIRTQEDIEGHCEINACSVDGKTSSSLWMQRRVNLLGDVMEIINRELSELNEAGISVGVESLFSSSHVASAASASHNSSNALKFTLPLASPLLTSVDIVSNLFFEFKYVYSTEPTTTSSSLSNACLSPGRKATVIKSPEPRKYRALDEHLWNSEILRLDVISKLLIIFEDASKHSKFQSDIVSEHDYSEHVGLGKSSWPHPYQKIQHALSSRGNPESDTSEGPRGGEVNGFGFSTALGGGSASIPGSGKSSNKLHRKPDISPKGLLAGVYTSSSKSAVDCISDVLNVFLLHVGSVVDDESKLNQEVYTQQCFNIADCLVNSTMFSHYQSTLQTQGTAGNVENVSGDSNAGGSDDHKVAMYGAYNSVTGNRSSVCECWMKTLSIVGTIINGKISAACDPFSNRRNCGGRSLGDVLITNMFHHYSYLLLLPLQHQRMLNPRNRRVSGDDGLVAYEAAAELYMFTLGSMEWVNSSMQLLSSIVLYQQQSNKQDTSIQLFVQFPGLRERIIAISSQYIYLMGDGTVADNESYRYQRYIKEYLILLSCDVPNFPTRYIPTTTSRLRAEFAAADAVEHPGKHSTRSPSPPLHQSRPHQNYALSAVTPVLDKSGNMSMFSTPGSANSSGMSTVNISTVPSGVSTVPVLSMRGLSGSMPYEIVAAKKYMIQYLIASLRMMRHSMPSDCYSHSSGPDVIMVGMRYKDDLVSENSLVPLRPTPYEVGDVVFYSSPALEGSVVQGKIMNVFQLQSGSVLGNPWYYSMKLVENGEIESEVRGHCLLYYNQLAFSIASYSTFCGNKTDKVFPLPANAVALEKDAMLLKKYSQGHSGVNAGTGDSKISLTPSSLFCHANGLDTAHLHSLLLCMLSTNTNEILGSNELIEILSGEIVMLLLLNIRHGCLGICDDSFRMHVDEIFEILECISLDRGNNGNNYSFAKWVREGSGLDTSNSTELKDSNNDDWKQFLTWVLKEFNDQIYPAIAFNRQSRFSASTYATASLQDKQDWGTASIAKQLTDYSMNVSGYSATNNSHLQYGGYGDNLSSPYSVLHTPRKI